MKAFKIDNNGDLVIENGNLIMIEGNEELRQSIERILTTNKEEWFLDMNFGLDYQAIQGKGKSAETIKLAISEAIYQDSRIKNVDIKDVIIDRNRHLKIYGTATDVNDNVIDLNTLQEVIEVE
ncbi:DUF2634 domain-containing protein [Tissierella praeacuta]|uniref:DUF2634 domain-containing protein n=1 Tax=Tissierella praeacuta TaxID=43131 RepID=UPI002FD8C8B6